MFFSGQRNLKVGKSKGIGAKGAAWQDVEQDLAIICACGPALKPFYNRYVGSDSKLASYLRGGSSRSKSATTEPPASGYAGADLVKAGDKSGKKSSDLELGKIGMAHSSDIVDKCRMGDREPREPSASSCSSKERAEAGQH